MLSSSGALVSEAQPDNNQTSATRVIMCFMALLLLLVCKNRRIAALTGSRSRIASQLREPAILLQL
jgi:hypothetical protein